MEENQNLNYEIGVLTKKPYSKPTIGKVNLVANEAVLATCKWGISQGGRAACTPDVTCVVGPRS